MKLSILIATIPQRKAMFEDLQSQLTEQMIGIVDKYGSCPVEILSDDNTDDNIGEKRQKLLERAKGVYIVYIDDDDHVSGDYIEKILQATETNPDCIGISGFITRDNHWRKAWHISKDYNCWHETFNAYMRTPNHISPVRRELALQVGFKPISFAEDKDYSDRLLPLLKTEVIVPGELYHYDYRSVNKNG